MLLSFTANFNTLKFPRYYQGLKGRGNPVETNFYFPQLFPIKRFTENTKKFSMVSRVVLDFFLAVNKFAFDSALVDVIYVVYACLKEDPAKLKEDDMVYFNVPPIMQHCSVKK